MQRAKSYAITVNLAALAINTMNGLLCWCRSGFEPDLAAELTSYAAEVGIPGYARTERGSGYVVFHTEDGAALDAALPWESIVFARQKMRVLAELRGLPASDRITPMLEILQSQGMRFGELWVEHPDSDEGKPLAGLARSFGNALRPVLRKAGLLTQRDNTDLPRLHVAFVDGDHAFLAQTQPEDSAPWPLGIPRLKMHPDAPSRSALKLEEALLVLLSAQESEMLLKPGMRAADLGAAPGGWTWVLTRHGLRVSAIDNGPLKPHLFETGQIEHLREDGFRWHPATSLDWMVCDMVEQPIRVAERMAEWFAQGWCRHAIFNLKLPMKKRWQETERCLALFAEQAGQPLTLRAKQLYHDREEITVFASTKR